jgi:hypothetical protein
MIKVKYLENVKDDESLTPDRINTFINETPSKKKPPSKSSGANYKHHIEHPPS